MSAPTAVLVAIALTSAYGASDECHQFFVRGRDASYRDWFADTCGGAVGVTIYGAIGRIVRLLTGSRVDAATARAQR